MRREHEPTIVITSDLDITGWLSTLLEVVAQRPSGRSRLGGLGEGDRPVDILIKLIGEPQQHSFVGLQSMIGER